jgi:hypothetical protein
MLSFVMSVGIEKFGSHSKDFHEIWYLSIFKNRLKN